MVGIVRFFPRSTIGIAVSLLSPSSSIVPLSIYFTPQLMVASNPISTDLIYVSLCVHVKNPEEEEADSPGGLRGSLTPVSTKG